MTSKIKTLFKNSQAADNGVKSFTSPFKLESDSKKPWFWLSDMIVNQWDHDIEQNRKGVCKLQLDRLWPSRMINKHLGQKSFTKVKGCFDCYPQQSS